MFDLVVIEPFGLIDNEIRRRFQKGDVITDPALVARVDADFPRHVVRRLRTAPAPAEE